MNFVPDNLDSQIRDAVRLFWASRDKQLQKQIAGKRPDQGLRAAVTGGKHMSGFSKLISKCLERVGVLESSIFHSREVELPGYYRGTKQWDLLVVQQEALLAAIEVKSHIGPSFGNNLNNRVEEAVGSATDIWTAFREGKFGSLIHPWLGYLILVEKSPKSTCPVSVREPHFEVFSDFKDASYIERYEIFCSKLVRERLYSHATLLTAEKSKALEGSYKHPSSKLSLDQFLLSLTSHVSSSLERLKVE